jgi:hypothetical protein
MKIAYNSWEDRGVKDSFDIRRLSGQDCTNVDLYQEDLVWTNLTRCRSCRSIHFGPKWRWMKAGSPVRGRDDTYLPMVEMKARDVPHYLKDVAGKLKRRIKGKTPVTMHIWYESYGYCRRHELEDDEKVTFGIFCQFERFPRGYDNPFEKHFPDSI